MAIIATDAETIYARLLARVQALVSTAPIAMDTTRVMLSVIPRFVSIASPYIQIIPGSGTMPHADSGPSVVHETFSVVVFHAVQLDRPGEDTERLTNESAGILQLREHIRGDGSFSAASGLRNHYLLNASSSQIVHEPIRLVSFTPATPAPGNDAWVMIEDMYRTSYQLS